MNKLFATMLALFSFGMHAEAAKKPGKKTTVRANKSKRAAALRKGAVPVPSGKEANDPDAASKKSKTR